MSFNLLASSKVWDVGKNTIFKSVFSSLAGRISDLYCTEEKTLILIYDQDLPIWTQKGLLYS